MSIDATCTHPSCEAKGTYWMLARCTNCRRDFDVELTKGHGATDTRPDCPFCGTHRWIWEPLIRLEEKA